LIWELQQAPSSLTKRLGSVVDVVFVCKYGDKNLRLYEKCIWEEVIDLKEFEMLTRTKLESAKAAVLEFVDENGNGLWSFPQLEIIKDLLSTVQYKVAGVKDFLAELLAS
ncbi:MAG: hypothetical protein C5B55_05585, partial [Blastocatellia bacterium]